jgi:hypothetical protein
MKARNTTPAIRCSSSASTPATAMSSAPSMLQNIAV